MKRRRIIVAATLLLVVGGFVAWIGGTRRADRLRYEAAVRALAEQGQLEQLFGPPVPETEAEQKRLDELTRKIAGTLPPTDVLQRVGPNLYLPAWRGPGLGDPTNAPMDWTESARQVDAASEELAEIWKILAINRPRSWLPRTNWDEGFAESFRQRRDRVHFLAAAALIRMHQERPADSAELIEAILSSARRFRQDDGWIELMTRANIGQLGVTLLQGAVGEVRMEVEELARLQGSLEQFDWLGSVPQALAAERVRFVQLANEARSMSAKERSELGARVELSRVEYWWTVFKGDFNAGYREASGVLSLLNRQIEDVARSMDSPAAMRTLPDKLAPPDGYWRELGFLAKAIRGYDRGLKQLFHIESQRRMAVLRIAAERFRLRHGRYPERAEDLVPEFLAAVPLDPLDGQPVRYRIGENGKPFLHCVGLDGVDQGGAGDALDDSGSSPDWPWPQIATTPAEEVAP